MANNILPPIPTNPISECHAWRDFFFNLGRYIQVAQVGGSAWTVVQGGTGVTNITGYLKGNGTSPFSAVSTVPTTDLSGTISFSQGGTGAGSQQLGMNAIAGAVTSGSYLRGNGTNVVMSAIQVADVPTLNQNTSGTASNITASSNGTITTLSALSLPGSQVTGNVSGNLPSTFSSYATAPSGITVTASPFSYQNTSTYPSDVIISGGTVTLIEFTRDNTTFYTTGLLMGVVTLSPNDRVRVTYTVAPTMTNIPR